MTRPCATSWRRRSAFNGQGLEGLGEDNPARRLRMDGQSLEGLGKDESLDLLR